MVNIVMWKSEKKKESAILVFLLFLFSSLVMLAGCESRNTLDDTPISTVQIKLDWTDITDKLPEGMRVIFYPKNIDGRKAETYISAMGGEVNVQPGSYSMLIYNFDTECIKVRGEDSYETIEAVATRYSGTDVDEAMNWSPDPLYIVALDDVEIVESDAPLQMEFKPENSVRRYSFEIKVTGLKNVANVICSVEGLDGSFFMGMNSCCTSDLPIFAEMKKGDGVLKGTFSCFVMTKREYFSPVATRVGVEVMLSLKLVKLDNTVQKVEVNITQVVASPTPGGDVEEPDAPGEDDVTIEIPLDEEIVVDDVKPTPGGDSGIGGNVGDWGDETDVEL